MNSFRLLLILPLLMIAQLGLAQTRKIGHRSHSGKSETFALLMAEDRLGRNYAMDPIYEVEPFVLRIRQHYENIAKQDPKSEVENPTQPYLPNILPADSAKIPMPEQPQEQLIPNSKKKSKSHQQMAAEIPSPDFLVKTRPKTEGTSTSNTAAPASSSLWVLLGLLAFPVAPGIFFASAVMGRRRVSESA